MPSESCPSTDQLKAYLLGQLQAEYIDEVSRHVDHCPPCEDTVAALERQGDTFLSGLRGNKQAKYQGDENYQRALAFVKKLGSEAAPAASNRDPADDALPIGNLREYELLEKLGEGGMGAVYKARHTKLDKVVAIKILPTDRMKDQGAVTRFEREMRAVGKLEHPNIVRAMDAGEVDGMHFLVMEYVEGLDLSQLVKLSGPLPIADACELIRQAAMGLDEAHEHGMVHRDIKPSNIMLCQASGRRKPPATPVVKILDMGLALLSEAHSPDARGLTNTGQMMGTLDYMAPEQGGDSHEVDIRADVYALGATLYKLLTGEVIYHGEKFQAPVQKMMALATLPAPPIQSRRQGIPAELAAIVHRMLEKDPAKRYATPEEVAQALAPFCAGADLAKLLSRAGFETAPAGDGAPSGTQPSITSPNVDTGISKTGRPPMAKPPVSRQPRQAEIPHSVCRTPIQKPARRIPHSVLAGIACAAGALALLLAAAGSLLVLGQLATAIGCASAAGVLSLAAAGGFIFRNRGGLVIAGGVLGLGGTALLAGMIFFFQTPTGTLRVEINDPSVEVAVKGSDIVLKQADKEEVKLQPGEHTLVVTRGDFTFETKQLVLKRGETTTVKVELLPGRVQVVSGTKVLGDVALSSGGDSAAARTSEYALQFQRQGKSHVIVTGIKFDRNGPLTLEAVVVPQAAVKPNEFEILFDLGGPTVSLAAGNQLRLVVAQKGEKITDVRGPLLQPRKRYHVAAVCDGQKLRLFVDGKQVAEESVDDKPLIGGGNDRLVLGTLYTGVIDEVRISNIARYEKDFAPRQRFAPDADTLALYHCDEGLGDILRDSSGNNFHGKIVGAKWVKQDGGTEIIKAFAANTPTIDRDGVTPEAGGWKIVAKGDRTARLFELPKPGVDNCLVIYRAKIKTQDVDKRAYLEMLCRLPGDSSQAAEYFSKGLHNAVGGTTDWATIEIPFRLERGHSPDSIKLNVTIDGGGTVWIKDVQLLKQPLPGSASVASQGLAVPPGRWLELLPLVDVKDDVVAGRWQRKDGSLVSADDLNARLALPVIPEGDYELEVKYRRTNGRDTVALVLPVAGRAAAVFPDGPRTGLEMIDGQGVWSRDNPTSKINTAAVAGKTRTAVISVSVADGKATVRGTRDGAALFNWSGDVQSLSMYDAWELNDRRRPGIGGMSNAFESVRLRMLTGQARLLRPTPDEGPLAATDRSVAEWAKRLGAPLHLELNGERQSLVMPGIPLPDENFKLRGLNFVDAGKVTDADLATVCQLDIRSLQLENAQVTDAGLKSVANLKNLKLLNLSGTKISDAGLVNITAPTLAHWQLSRTAVSDVGMRHLKTLSSLKLIALVGTKITDTGLDQLLELPNLTTLFLDDTKITNEGLKAIERSRLTRVSLNRASVTAAAVEQLRKARPDMQVDFAVPSQVNGIGLTLRSTLTGHADAVWTAAFSPEGNQVASGGLDNTVILWDVAKQAEMRKLRGHSDMIRGISFAPDGETLATASKDTTLKLWNVDEGSEVLTLRGHGAIVTSVAFAPNGETLLSSSDDRTARVWNITESKPQQHALQHKYWVTSVACSPDGKTAASGGWDHTVKLWNIETGEELRTLAADAPVWSVAISPDGESVVAGCHGGTVRQWETATGRQQWHLNVPAGACGVAFHPGGGVVAVADGAGNVHLLDAKTSKQLAVAKEHAGIVRAVAFSPDGATLASAGEDKTVKLWDVTGVPPISSTNRSGQVADYDRFAKGKWVRVFSDKQELRNTGLDEEGTVKLQHDGVVALDGAFVMDTSRDAVVARDAIVRAKIQGSAGLYVRCSGKSYDAALSPEGVGLNKWDGKESKQLGYRQFPSPDLSQGERSSYRELALAAVGDRLLVFVDGRRYLDVVDGDFKTPGPCAIHAYKSQAKLQDIQVMSLDGLDVADLLPVRDPLARWVGGWDVTRTLKLPGQPERASTGVMVVTRANMSGFYTTLSKFDFGVDSLFVSRFLPEKSAIQNWSFWSNGLIEEYEKPVDLETGAQTVAKPTPIGGQMIGQIRFLDKDTSEMRLVTTAPDGKPVSEMISISNRRDARLPFKPISLDSDGPAEDTPALAALNGMVGVWDVETHIKPSKYEPEGRRVTGRNAIKWYLGGRFLLGQEYTSDDQLDAVWLWGYEAKTNTYPFVMFQTSGNVATWSEVWDADTKTLKGKAHALPKGWTGEGETHIVDENTIEFWATIKNDRGEVMFDMQGTKRRVKAVAPEAAAMKKFEFRLAQYEPADGWEEMTDPLSKKKIYVDKTAAVSNADVAAARVVTNELGEPAIAIDFAGASQKKIGEFSSGNIGKLCAIFIDGKLNSAPVIREKFSDKTEIWGKFTRPQAAAIANGITAK